MELYCSKKESIPEDKKKIVEEVFSTRREGESNDRFPGAEIVVFSYGMKELMLATKRNSREFLTFIENKFGEETRKENEKYILYSSALKLMQKIVDEEKIPYEYRLLTENQKIKNWARGKGNEIFKWNEINEYSDDPLFVARKSIDPENKE